MNNSYEQLKEENQFTQAKNKIKAQSMRKLFSYISLISITMAAILFFLFLKYQLMQSQLLFDSRTSALASIRQELTQLTLSMQNITAMKGGREEQIDSLNLTYRIKFDQLAILHIKHKDLRNKLKAIEETPSHFSTILLSYTQKRLIEQMTDLKIGKVCFRSSRDTHDSAIFHSKCDEIAPTLTVVKTTKGAIFGGVTYETWSGNRYKTDDRAFLFSVGLKKKYPVISGSSAIYTSRSLFPCFGYMDIAMSISYNFVNAQLNSFTNATLPYEINDGEKNYDIEELEVFQLVDLD